MRPGRINFGLLTMILVHSADTSRVRFDFRRSGVQGRIGARAEAVHRFRCVALRVNCEVPGRVFVMVSIGLPSRSSKLHCDPRLCA